MSIAKKLDKISKNESAVKRQYLMMRLNRQLFGILVDNIDDVISQTEITPIPLAPPEIKGTLNLRGRIVTAINLQSRLNMEEPAEEKTEYKSIVVDIDHNLYSIIVDIVSDVIYISDNQIDRLPDNLSEKWKEVSNGVYSMEKELMVILDTRKLLEISGVDDEEDEQ